MLTLVDVLLSEFRSAQYNKRVDAFRQMSYCSLLTHAHIEPPGFTSLSANSTFEPDSSHPRDP